MTPTVHATVVAAPFAEGWRAVMLTGPSGAGKSDLALRLMRAGFRLVADDRAHVWASGGRLYATAPETLAGRIEARGLGVLKTTIRPMARVRLIVRLTSELVERMPDPAFQTLAGLQIPLVNLDPRPASAVALVAGALTGFDRDAVWPI